MYFPYNKTIPDRPDLEQFIEVSLPHLPVFLKLSANKLLGSVFVFFGFFIWIMAALVVLAALLAGSDLPWGAVAMFALFIGVGYWFHHHGNILKTHRHSILFRHQAIKIARKDKDKGIRIRTIPYDAFSHVEYGFVYRKRGQYGSISYGAIKLCHDDADWSVPLFLQADSDPREKAQAYAAHFGLTARNSDSGAAS